MGCLSAQVLDKETGIKSVSDISDDAVMEFFDCVSRTDDSLPLEKEGYTLFKTANTAQDMVIMPKEFIKTKGEYSDYHLYICYVKDSHGNKTGSIEIWYKEKKAEWSFYDSIVWSKDVLIDKSGYTLFKTADTAQDMGKMSGEFEKAKGKYADYHLYGYYVTDPNGKYTGSVELWYKKKE
jgi:hypothetical protein